MATLHSRCGHYIFLLWFLSSFFRSSFFIPCPYQRSQIGCLPYFYTWCGLSANLECRCEICCMQLAGNAELKKSPKTRHLGTIAQLCPAISLQLRCISTIGKKLVKEQYLLHMSLQHGELQPTSGSHRFVSLGHPS